MPIHSQSYSSVWFIGVLISLVLHLVIYLLIIATIFCNCNFLNLTNVSTVFHTLQLRLYTCDFLISQVQLYSAHFQLYLQLMLVYIITLISVCLSITMPLFPSTRSSLHRVTT